MKGLLLVLVLSTLLASLEAAEEFRQIEEGVFVLGAEEEGEPWALSPDGNGWLRLNVEPDANGEAVVHLWPGGPRTHKIDSRYNLVEGSIGLWDRMLAHYQPQRTAVPDTQIVQDIPYIGNALLTINFIRVVQTSGKDATPTIVSGGLGMTFVTIRLTSPPGEGFQFSIDIWGR